MHSPAEERARRNEAFRRESNELLVRAELEEASREAEAMCECAMRGCMERISITPREYVETHSAPTRFIVVPGHVFPEVEDVVESRPTYVVVEKLPD
jgi:hypothetical protein